MKTADRLTGLFFLLLGAALYWVVIPAQTETVDSGWVLPQTLPNLTAIIIGLCGASLLVRPGREASPRPPEPGTLLRAAATLALLIAGVWLIGLTGFGIAAAPLALAIMWWIGERRMRWLALGGILMPALIWFAVVILLDRPLP